MKRFVVSVSRIEHVDRVIAADSIQQLRTLLEGDGATELLDEGGSEPEIVHVVTPLDGEACATDEGPNFDLGVSCGAGSETPQFDDPTDTLMRLFEDNNKDPEPETAPLVVLEGEDLQQLHAEESPRAMHAEDKRQHVLELGRALKDCLHQHVWPTALAFWGTVGSRLELVAVIEECAGILHALDASEEDSEASDGQ